MDTCACDPLQQSGAGTFIKDDVEYCSACRKPTQGDEPVEPEPLPERPAMSRPAVVAFVSAVLAYLVWSVPLFTNALSHTFVGGIGWIAVVMLFLLALIVGIVAMRGTRGHKRRGRGFAVAAILLSLLPIPLVFLSSWRWASR